MQAHCPTADAVAQDAAVDHAIMGLLVIDHPGVWSVEEIERSIGNPGNARDGLSRLAASGLIHRLDGFVFASRSAAHVAALHG